uniref:Uncharacterized protein n=1 Tax=Physcomitrium patens TaxID=3218 RepID=A0A7I3Z7N6_PHYPA
MRHGRDGRRRKSDHFPPRFPSLLCQDPLPPRIHPADSPFLALLLCPIGCNVVDAGLPEICFAFVPPSVAFVCRKVVSTSWMVVVNSQFGGRNPIRRECFEWIVGF